MKPQQIIITAILLVVASAVSYQIWYDVTDQANSQIHEFTQEIEGLSND